jgi:carbon monoxide dehydrogenase subunit G
MLCAWPAPGAPRIPQVIDYRASFELDAPPERVWQAIERSEGFEHWWGWLSEFRLEGEGLVDGAVLRGVVAPPVPYRMRLSVELERCSPPSSIDAAVHGDLEGTARLLLEPEGSGTRAEVSWTIEMMQRSMRIAARVARPVLVWGHDRVVDMTVSSFRRQLARLPP